LFPVTDQEIPLEIEKPLELPNLVQHWQAGAALHDQQRRLSFAFGAETDALAGAIDVEVYRSVNCVSCRCRHW